MTRRLPELGLLALCVLLAGALWAELRPTPAPPPPSLPPARPELRASVPSPPALSALGAFVTRPLFVPSRRPAATSRTAALRVAFRLCGVLLTGSTRVALLQPVDGKPVRLLHVGDRADGWDLAAIGSDRIVLRRGARRAVMKLGDRAPSTAPTKPIPIADPVPPPPAPFTHLWSKDTRWLAR
ncbi:MAG: hypothetical protein ACP5NP_02130 [Acetobacteraceae bacterium]